MKKDADDSLIRSLGSAGEAVLAIGVLSGFGAWGGFQLDERFHSSPWLAVGLALLGMALGLTRMVMQALAAEKNEPKIPLEKK
jgi:F0F1-type ATP synthase assembly protein I